MSFWCHRDFSILDYYEKRNCLIRTGKKNILLHEDEREKKKVKESCGQIATITKSKQIKQPKLKDLFYNLRNHNLNWCL